MAKSSFYPHVALPPNRLGEDYLVGDIHGAFTKVREHLDAVGFDPLKDRLLSVGDLVDRNPNSAEALAWLQQPWFHAVRGNHEDMFLNWHFHPRSKFSQEYFDPKNGGSWVSGLAPLLREQLVSAIEQIPYIISVPYHDRWVALVHANLPTTPVMHETGGKRIITRESLFSQQVAFTGKLIQSLTWSRSRLRQANNLAQLSYWQAPSVSSASTASLPAIDIEEDPLPRLNHHVPGYALIAVGHSTLKHPCFLGDFVYLDTGGWIPNCPFTVIKLSKLLSLHSTVLASEDSGDKADNCLVCL